MTQLFLSVLGTSLSVSALILLLFILSPFLHRRYAAKWKYLIWCVLAFRLLLPFGAGEVRSAADILRPEKNHTAVSESTAEAAPAGPFSPRVVVEIPRQMTAPLSVRTEKKTSILDVLAAIWAVGSAVYISINIAGYLHYRKRVFREGSVIKDAAVLQQLLRCKHELRIRRTVLVMEFSGAASPMALGFLKPVLILPEEYYSGEEIFFILRHELVHVKRKDTWLKLLFMLSAGVHWFNPIVWIMQKEAAVCMELACDERVVQGADFETRKAYTKTLLSTLHKGYVKSTLLTTGFYEGKKIMEKRFRGILSKAGRKNGLYILVCTVILAVCAGTLAGCSVIKNGEESAAEADDDWHGENVYWKRGAIEEEGAANDNSADVRTAGDVITLTIMKEGIPEEKQARLTVEDGYVLYLPDGEWRKEEADTWQAVDNEDVRIQVAGFESSYPIEQLLTDDGYVPDETGMVREEAGIRHHVRLYEAETGLWCVFYSYPLEAEEGFGSELPVIVDTFAVLLPGESITETGAISGQVLGYISTFDGAAVTIDRQDWVTSESPDWKPEYNADAGFEIVDLEGGDVTYQIRDDCTYHVLENHQGEQVELSKEEFVRYWRETEFPIFWAIELEDGQVKSFAEWYLP